LVSQSVSFLQFSDHHPVCTSPVPHTCQVTRTSPRFEHPNICEVPVPVAARSKAWVCGRSPAEIVGSNATGGMDVCLLRVLSGRGLCDGLITRPEESYRLSCVFVCDLETSWMRRPWPTGGCCGKTNKYLWSTHHKAPHHVVFSNTLLGPISGPQMRSSAPHSCNTYLRNFKVTKCRTQINQAKLEFCIF
jgi:hypothetical protein